MFQTTNQTINTRLVSDSKYELRVAPHNYGGACAMGRNLFSRFAMCDIQNTSNISANKWNIQIYTE